MVTSPEVALMVTRESPFSVDESPMVRVVVKFPVPDPGRKLNFRGFVALPTAALRSSGPLPLPVIVTWRDAADPLDTRTICPGLMPLSPKERPRGAVKFSVPIFPVYTSANQGAPEGAKFMVRTPLMFP